jgi:hypothetical protein
VATDELLITNDVGEGEPQKKKIIDKEGEKRRKLVM